MARDPLNRGAAFINPLELVTDQEKEIFAKGEMNKKRYTVFLIYYFTQSVLFFICRRYQISQETLFKQIPNIEEQELVHDFFMKTVDHCGLRLRCAILANLVLFASFPTS